METTDDLPAEADEMGYPFEISIESADSAGEFR